MSSLSRGSYRIRRAGASAAPLQAIRSRPLNSRDGLTYQPTATSIRPVGFTLPRPSEFPEPGSREGSFAHRSVRVAFLTLPLRARDLLLQMLIGMVTLKAFARETALPSLASTTPVANTATRRPY